MYILLLILSHKDNTRSGSFDFQRANNCCNIHLVFPLAPWFNGTEKRTAQFLKNGFGGSVALQEVSKHLVILKYKLRGESFKG